VEHPAAGITQTMSFAYNAAAHTTTITDPTGKTRVHGYSGDGALSTFRDEEGGMITLNPDPSGRRSEVTDQMGNTTSISFHAPSGRPERITNVEGDSATFTYAARKVGGITFYDLVKTVRADGTVRTFTYDAKGNRPHLRQIRSGKKTSLQLQCARTAHHEDEPAGGVATFTYDETSPVKGTVKRARTATQLRRLTLTIRLAG
jgi:YD repeat-containing protein